MTSYFRIIISALLFIMMLGCGGQMGGVGPGMDPQEAVVKELGDLLRCGNVAPRRLDDLKSFESNFPVPYRALKMGEIVVLWGIPMLGEGDAATKEGKLVAYEKDAPKAGGWILMTNGTVKKVTAEEYAAFHKATN